MPQPTFLEEGPTPKRRDGKLIHAKKILGRRQDQSAGAATNNPRQHDKLRSTLSKYASSLGASPRQKDSISKLLLQINQQLP